MFLYSKQIIYYFYSQPLVTADVKPVCDGATTLSITTFRITKLSIMGLFVIISINDAQHNNILIA